MLVTEVATLILLGAPACSKPQRCLAIERGNELVVTLRDAQTKASICDAHVFVGQKSFERHELVANDSCVYQREGYTDDVLTFDVSHPSYQNARREGIRAEPVEVNGCLRDIANVDIELEH